MADPRYEHPDYTYGLDVTTLRSLDADEQLDVMRHWFHQNYDNPANSTPWDSEDQTYVWIWGGPYDAREELEEEFGGVVSDALIEQLADEFSGESVEWTRHPQYDDYDDSLFDAIASNSATRTTLEAGLVTIEELSTVQPAHPAGPALRRLLFANVISALETYLSDTFINAVFNDEKLLQRFIETNPDFEKRQLKYSEVFEAYAKVKETAKSYLLDVVWHNMAKVQAMYESTLGVKFAPGLADVAKAIPIRHDIVHRNGKTKDGKTVEVSAGDLEKLMASVRSMADAIDEQLFPISDAF
jgi:hypothetical protein